MTTKQTTTAKRPAAKKTTTLQDQTQEELYKKVPKHYEAVKAKGVAFMIQTTGLSVFDEDHGEVRQIRFCEGENSIYRDEQSDASVSTPVVFENGHLFVPPSQPNLAKFLDKHPGNKANGGNQFFFVDHNKKAKDTIQKEFLLIDALSMVRTKPMDDLLSVATALGMNTDRLADEIKHDLMVYAKKNPASFMEMFDDPATKVKSDIKKAMSYGVISSDKGYVRWKDTNNHIIAVPEGKDAVDVFTRYCLTEAGSPVYEELKRQLS